MLEYKQPIKIGGKSHELGRKEVFGEDHTYNRFKFWSAVVGWIFSVIFLWTHGFGVFDFERQQSIKPVAPSVMVNMPPPTVVAPVVVQSVIPAATTPIVRPPVQQTAKSAPPKAVIPLPAPPPTKAVSEVVPKPAEPPKLYW